MTNKKYFNYGEDQLTTGLALRIASGEVTGRISHTATGLIETEPPKGRRDCGRSSERLWYQHRFWPPLHHHHFRERHQNTSIQHFEESQRRGGRTDCSGNCQADDDSEGTCTFDGLLRHCNEYPREDHLADQQQHHPCRPISGIRRRFR